MKNFIFTAEPESIEMHDSFKGIVRFGVSDVSGLMDAVAEAMNFPKYFGENWNALSDCLRDFNWIEETNILIVHKEVPNLENEQLSVYIDILKDSVSDWTQEDEHELFVVFPVSSEKRILNLI